MDTLLKILKAALTSFSKINMVQYIGIATLIVSSWQGADLISASWVLILTGGFTLALKLWQSSKEMVSTGFTLDWSVWVAGALGLVIGFTDQFIPNVDIMNSLFGDKSNAVIMVYLALTIILRTGFTNQSLNSVADRKAG